MDSGEVCSNGNILNDEGNFVLAPIKQLEKVSKNVYYYFYWSK